MSGKIKAIGRFIDKRLMFKDEDIEALKSYASVNNNKDVYITYEVYPSVEYMAEGISYIDYYEYMIKEFHKHYSDILTIKQAQRIVEHNAKTNSVSHPKIGKAFYKVALEDLEDENEIIGFLSEVYYYLVGQQSVRLLNFNQWKESFKS